MSLPSADVRRLGSTFSLLLSPIAFGDPESWRREAAFALRELAHADAAVIARQSGQAATYLSIGLDAATVRAYESHYASVDFGIKRQRRRALALWARRALWRGRELERSEYFNDFAVPHRLGDAVGMAAFGASHCARVSLLFARRLRTSTHGRLLRLLSLVLPAFRAGAAMSFHAREGQSSQALAIDRAPAEHRWSFVDLGASHGLTRRELQVAELLRHRRSNSEIACMLRISEHTARHHTESVLLKLGLHSRTQVELHCPPGAELR